jgi:hypothetical protein
MIPSRGTRDAFVHRGIEPRWTHGYKDEVGAAYSADSRLAVAPIDRLEALTECGGDMRRTASVASMFVSRIDERS